jgi:hypothetical protein
MIFCEWDASELGPQKDTLDRTAYTCMLVSYRRLSSQFQFSLSGVTLVYCISLLLLGGGARPPPPPPDRRQPQSTGAQTSSVIESEEK